MFKSKVTAGHIFSGYNITITNKVDITLNTETIAIARKRLTEFFTNAHTILAKMSQEHRRISFDEIKSILHSYSEIEKEEFIETFKIVYAHDADAETSSDFVSYCRIYPIPGAFQLVQQGYERTETLYLNTFDKYIDSKAKTFYCTPFSPVIKLAELLNSLNIGDYERFMIAEGMN